MPRSCSAAALLLLVVLLAAPLQPTSAANPDATAFGRAAFLKKLTLLGSASILQGRQLAVALTTNSSDGIGAGRALFSDPVRLLLPRADPRAAPAQASFATRFTFRITPSPSYGDGLAFILTSSPTFLGASNGYMGLYAAAPAPASAPGVSTVALELDTHHDVALHDPDGNHVAVDAGSIFSVASASPGVNLKAGVPITAWVQYHARRRRLQAWISYSSSRRHLDPALSLAIDLSGLVEELMYVGFSASNGEGGRAIHLIENWSFRTFWDLNTAQGPPPLPSSTQHKDETSVSSTPPTSATAKHRHVVPAVLGALIFVLVLGGIICVLFHRRRRKAGRRVQLAVQSEMARSV
ncbi:L-type lectin-domain containing receptor kinase S.7-like [Triticum dicoccoides]|uniref:L-type lectin-domain containing receptor kinase S.7-like n=1 Tax=Triticum dicoccoides TaxID=85692 RepID=UPI00188F8584|nr:L-type lectin-domain containing receptor kinase S.7-like [Triticum dicoccoides]XP_044337839.1 L-type lectin-domain containing receptor kinase S.7-like [Triticum aestivum]